jgi:hypothetical protein
MKNLPCKTVRAAFSAYLDGAVSGRQMHLIARYLVGVNDEVNDQRTPGCRSCTQDLAAWSAAQEALSALGPVKAPTDLALRLRRAIADERERQTSHLLARIGQSWQNTVRPMLLQVSAGFAGSLALVGCIALLLGAAAAPRNVQANDEPLGALTAPHLLYSTAASGSAVTVRDSPIVVEASVDSRGRVYDYKIVSGEQDPATRSQVANQLLSSVFQPASAFGIPVRGRVVVTFAAISVHP